jgi:hypothetical protein
MPIYFSADVYGVWNEFRWQPSGKIGKKAGPCVSLITGKEVKPVPIRWIDRRMPDHDKLADHMRNKR